MLDLKNYPVSLQLLMQTDGTVTELIKLLSKEEVNVTKISEKIDQIKQQKILTRCIFLHGVTSKKNWLYAKSKIYLDNLPQIFVDDLLQGNIPIGTLWTKYQMETFKHLVDQKEEELDENIGKGFEVGSLLLTRVYRVYNQQKIIMQITEKFPIKKYSELMI